MWPSGCLWSTLLHFHQIARPFQTCVAYVAGAAVDNGVGAEGLLELVEHGVDAVVVTHVAVRIVRLK